MGSDTFIARWNDDIEGNNYDGLDDVNDIDTVDLTNISIDPSQIQFPQQSFKDFLANNVKGDYTFNADTGTYQFMLKNKNSSFRIPNTKDVLGDITITNVEAVQLTPLQASEVVSVKEGRDITFDADGTKPLPAISR